MARIKIIYRNDKKYAEYHDDELVWKSPEYQEEADRVGITYISDEMTALEHPLNGQYYDSKSAFRRVTKNLGGVEIGNDYKSMPTRPAYNPTGIKESLIETMKKQGYF